ncbi:MAG: Hsp20/alpha crystallin family protein [Thermoleophilia bacterium]|nr:Hsp20/alpha crystallin family protein [Thermoleophilia bacterium]
MRIATDPSRELAMLQRDVTSMFDQFFGGRAGAASGRWVPPLDIVELDDHFALSLDLPGMTDDDVTIELEDRVLRIAGERADTSESSGDGMRRIERSFGSFERTLTLPRGIDPDAVTATIDHGVLEVTIPKPEERKPRRISVGSAGREDAAPLEVEGSEVADRELAHA